MPYTAKPHQPSTLRLERRAISATHSENPRLPITLGVLKPLSPRNRRFSIPILQEVLVHRNQRLLLPQVRESAVHPLLIPTQAAIPAPNGLSSTAFL